MRRGAVATTRALAQQAASADEIVRAAESLARMVAAVSNKAMTEQALGRRARSRRRPRSMRQQADQAAKALKEQARAMKDMTAAASEHRAADQEITVANREHSQSADATLHELVELRR